MHSRFLYFCQIIKQFDLPPSSFLCFFDICSLFTNVPLAETINICADTLYESDLIAPSFSYKFFIEFMQTAIKCVEFRFNNVIY